MSGQLKPKISSTGYRLFSILQLLMHGPVSKEEIVEKIDRVSYDTIRLDINTLKEAGFEIVTSDKSHGYKYFLNWNPIKIDFTQSEIRAFNQTKKAVMDVCDWEFIINLYEVFCKISKFVKDEYVNNEILNFDYFSNVDFKILKQLNTCCNNHHLIKILYFSPKNGEKIIDITCQKIIYKKDSKKLYLWGTSPQYEGFIYLRIDNILKIVNIDFNLQKNQNEFKTCKFRISHDIEKYFKLDFNEKITQNTPDFIEIEAVVESEFYFIQRILSLGSSCFWVEDDKLRKKILEKLLKMREKY